MRAIDANGKVLSGRPAQSKRVTFSKEDVGDPETTARIITELSNRILNLERVLQGEPLEIEITVPSNGTVYLCHQFNGPVRWFVTSWKATSGSYSLRTDAVNTTANVLALVSAAAGTAVVRIEPSQFALVV